MFSWVFVHRGVCLGGGCLPPEGGLHPRGFPGGLLGRLPPTTRIRKTGSAHPTRMLSSLEHCFWRLKYEGVSVIFICEWVSRATEFYWFLPVTKCNNAKSMSESNVQMSQETFPIDTVQGSIYTARDRYRDPYKGHKEVQHHVEMFTLI